MKCFNSNGILSSAATYTMFDNALICEVYYNSDGSERSRNTYEYKYYYHNETHKRTVTIIKNGVVYEERVESENGNITYSTKHYYDNGHLEYEYIYEYADLEMAGLNNLCYRTKVTYRDYYSDGTVWEYYSYDGVYSDFKLLADGKFWYSATLTRTYFNGRVEVDENAYVSLYNKGYSLTQAQ